MRSELLQQRQHLLGKGAEIAIGHAGPSLLEACICHLIATSASASCPYHPLPARNGQNFAKTASRPVRAGLFPRAWSRRMLRHWLRFNSRSGCPCAAPRAVALRKTLAVLAVQNSWGQKQITAVRTCDPSSSRFKPSESPRATELPASAWRSASYKERPDASMMPQPLPKCNQACVDGLNLGHLGSRNV